jgi:hypothetical protein
LFLDGLLSAEQRKTGWMRAEAAGDLVHGVSRQFSGRADGRRMTFATSYAITCLNISPMTMPC